MIVKVPPKRRDGKTSFARLLDYMTAGITALGIDPRKISFDTLTQYITAESVLNEIGDQVEKTIAVEIGNLSSLKNAATEMWAVSQRNTRCEDPVFHYILSWPEHERPAVGDIMAAARKTLSALGLQEHQYVVAVHANTDNIHAHVEVNRIHPLTYQSRHLEWSHKTLHRAARESEIEFGWSHDNGLWQVVEIDGKKLVLPNNDYVERAMDVLSSEARDYEVWTGKESFESYCKGEPAKALQRALRTRPLTWQTIHQVISRYGVELKDTGGGGLRVELIKQHEDDKPVAVAASKAFRFLKRKELEKELGPFEALDPNAPAGPKVKTYKRDPVKRLTRRLERHAQREALFQQYEMERDSAKAQRAMVTGRLKHSSKAANAERYRLLKASYMAKREQLKNDKTLAGNQKQQAYTLLKMTYEVAKEELREQIADERRQINELMPKLTSWRAWVEEQAQQGNEAAISALRGMVYQEKRDAKKRDGDEDDEQIPSIRPVPARPDDAPSIKRVFSSLEWRVSSNGRIFYHFRKTQALAFIDEGRRLTWGRDIVDDEALLATLRYAQSKWGNSLHISGGEEIFKARVVRMATSMGMKIVNPELQHLQGQLQTSKAHSVPAPATAAIPDSHEKRESELSRIAIAEKMRQVNPEAKIVQAMTQSKTYRGIVASVDETHALQQVGKGYVLHQLSTLDKLPVAGKDIEIRYHSNVGRVAPNNRARGR